jgi:tripartite-type tricarboxylate transporter receptor subunit TctC
MRFIIRCLSVMLFVAGASAARAQEYPVKPIRMLVPFAPGGVVDVTARILANKLTERLGWTILVENKPGGNGFIAVSAAAKSEPDGYTLLVAHTGEFAVNPAVFEKIIPYNLEKDFAPITMISDTPMLVVANKDAPMNNFREMIAVAKAKPDSISFSSPGTGSVNHLAGEWLANAAGVKLQHIPYKGGAPAAAAVAAGEVTLGVVAVPAVIAHLKSGRIKVLGLTTANRAEYDKSWPTAREQGVPELDASNWVGLFAPKGVPQPVLNKLYAEVKRTLEDPQVKERFASAGAETGGMAPAAFLTRIKKDADRYRAIVRAANLQISN